MKQLAIALVNDLVNYKVNEVENSLSSLYSREDVIKLLKSISFSIEHEFEHRLKSEEKPATTDGICLNVKKALDDYDYTAHIDLYSAEFDLCGNEISLTNVGMDEAQLTQEILDIIKENLINNK
jgi:galactitol-specific phosphotransferase system IIB component